VLGRPLEVLHADTSCDPADAIPAAKQLLAQGVVGVIGPETQEIDAVQALLTKTHVIIEFQGGDTSRDQQTDPYLFRDTPSDSQLGVAMALYARRMGYQRAAMLFYADAGAQTFRAPIRAAFTNLGGQIVSDLPVIPGQISYAQQVQQVIASKAQVIFTQVDAPTAAVLFRDANSVDGPAIPFIGTDVTAGADFLRAIGLKVAHDHLVSVYGTAVTGTATTEFAAALQVRFPGQQPMANATYAYDAVVTLALAQVQAKTVDGEKVKDVMTTVTNPGGEPCFSYPGCLTLLSAGTKINYEGASGNLDYDRYHNVFGPYGAFQADEHGRQQQIQLLDAEALSRATP
jgi:ABC-type branched-subunit amino acid transport system substrate-binding protein